MLTAILVDDDYPVLRYLSKTVPWRELGIELAGCYSNGLEAWEATQQNLPDIIITDIGMPKMNGLEMLEMFTSVHPRFKAIVLSCHNEFKYAQQAMKFNVRDYILKESLDIDQLQSSLKSIVSDMNSVKKSSEDMLLYKQKQSVNQSAFKEKFLKDTLYQASSKKNEWIERARLNGVHLEAKYYIPMVISIDRISTLARSRKMNDYTIVFAVENILQEVLESTRCVTFRFSNKQLVILFCCEDSAKEQQALYYAMERGIAAIQQYLKISVTCLVGRESLNPKEIQCVLTPILKQPEFNFYLRESKIHRFEIFTFSQEDIHTGYAQFFSDINNNIALNLPEVLRDKVIDWADWVRTHKFHPSDVKEMVLQLLLELQMKTKVTLQYHQDLSREKLYDMVTSIETLDHFKEWFIHYLNTLAQQLSILAIRSKRPEVIKAQQFVIQHVTEKITLEDMANSLNLNSSYFSRLFKQETNQNFIQYVNMVKLQKAKELLQQSNKAVEEISDYLGYANKSYFIKLFKREIGMKPSEYSVWK